MSPSSADRRADAWLAGAGLDDADLAFLGAPAAGLSISPSRADTTPAALRRVLQRFPLWDGGHDIDIEGVRCHDAGDALMAGDPLAARGTLEDAVAALCGDARRSLAVCGGDNSITYAGVRGLARGCGVDLASGRIALVTLDAHHDLREPEPAPTNGSPVAELLADGLPGSAIFQVGIGRFANQRRLGERARDAGITWYTTTLLDKRGWPAVMADVLAATRAELIYLDVDMDVLDRAFAPACPASLPGGARPQDLVDAVYRLARDPRVLAMDITEVDAAADVADITLRSAASVLLAFAAGIATRQA